jgi:hypothetical protein
VKATLCFVTALAALVPSACTTHNGGTPTATTSMVVGLSSEDMGATLGTIHVVTTVNGAVADDKTIDPVLNPKWFPTEIKVAPPAGATAGTVEVKIDGYLEEKAASSGTLLLSRLAKADFIPNQATLMRVTLQTQCLLPLPGGVGAPVCNAPTTCISGACASEATSLEPYEPMWATDLPDICKPASAGPPQVFVGTGQTDYLPVTDGQTLQAELGPQGGHHIWIATRMHNLKQAGSTTTLTATQPGTGLTVPATAYVFTFDADEGGYCKLYGLRFQLDANGNPYVPFLGKPLDVTVTIKDQSGGVGTSTAHINIAPTILCPGGQTSCM